MKWFEAFEKKTGRKLFASKGFGSDGSLVAVYEPGRRGSAFTRKSPEKCRELYTLGNALSEKENEEVTARFENDLYF
jgi:hypothetical protein